MGVLCSLLSVLVAAPETPAVLFVGGCGSEQARRLAATGLALDACAAPEGRALTFEQLRRYHVVVVQGLGRANADMSLNAVNRATLDALNQFLAAGGGVLVVANFGQMATAKPPQDALLRPLGLTPLFEEAVYDPPAGVVATPWKIAFAQAAPALAHPLTAGVGTVWYPAPTRRIGAQNHNITFTHDGSWTVVLAGAPTALSRTGPLQADPPTQPGRHASAPPLVAARQVGAGRLVYVGITPEYLFGAHATTTLEAVVLERGLRGVGSDGYRLVRNALSWLAEPALGKGLGGAPHNQALVADPHKTRFGRPFEWSARVAFPPVEPAFPGVIGARSAASSGRGTVEEWVAAAQAQGLAYLVFLEEFAKLTPQAFGQLKADCARLTTPRFAAIPGFAIDDEVGNHYFYCSPTLPYPDKQFLSPDGQVFVSRDPQVSPKDPYLKGQLAMTTLDYAYSLGSFRLTAGNYLLSRSAAPFANWFSNWDAFGLLTADAGKVVEDALPAYLQLVADGQGPLPMAIDRLDDPAQLATTHLRTVLRLPAKGGGLIGAELTAERKIGDYLSEWHLYPDNPAKIYVTDGPEIETWRYCGPRDYEGNTPGDFVWQNYRWRLNGRVKSAAGLAKVEVLDGDRPFRRYLPGGRTEFEFELDLTHDRQHNLVLIATDRDGRRAVSGEQWDRNHRLEEFMCSDRNNQLSYGYLTNREGYGMMLGGNQTLGTPIKRLGCGVSPSGTFRNDALLGAPAFDGAAGGEPEVWDSVALLTAGGEVGQPTAVEARRLLHSGDVSYGEGRREHRFTDNIGVHNVWHTLWRTTPATDFTVTRRGAFFQIDPDSPVATFLWQFELKLLRDLPNRGARLATLGTGETRRWCAVGSDGRQLAGVWGEGQQQWLALPFGLGASYAVLDSPLGGMAVFPLSAGLALNLSTRDRRNASLVLTPDATPQKAGESAHAEVLLVGLPRQTLLTRALPADLAQAVARFRHDYGLDGGDGGYLDGGEGSYRVTLEAGRLLGRRWLLEIDGQRDACFAGKLTGRTLSSLPLRVGGLQDRWSAYLYDRNRRAARPVGVFEGRAWATICLGGAEDLFVGHPLTADRAELALQVTQTGERSWRVEAHNPTDQPLHAALRLNPHFDPWRGKPTPAPVDLQAGESMWLEL